MLQPFMVQSVREDNRNVVLSDAARLSMSNASSMYSRPTMQAKPFQHGGIARQRAQAAQNAGSVPINSDST